jgi:hypothetical protein
MHQTRRVFPSRNRPFHRPGLTKTEIIIIIAVVCVFGAMVLVCGFAAILLPALGKARASARQLKDSTQVRGMVQAMIVWSSNNQTYPLPSEIDLKNTTVSDPGNLKDTTGNILSVMIFNGNISPEICISPAESNSALKTYETYEYSNPKAAAKPADALWDPAFRGTPADAPRGGVSGVGNQSYAHTLPFGQRRKQWSDTFNSTEAVFGNRGPTYVATDEAKSSPRWALLPGPTGTSSNTLLIHGGRTTWEGNIGYNDNHVNFELSPTPSWVTMATGPTAPGKRNTGGAPDNLFVNETDEYIPPPDPKEQGTPYQIGDQRKNAYLRPISSVTAPGKPNPWRD